MATLPTSLDAKFALKQFDSTVDLVRQPITAVVGTSATRILGNNPNRVSWTVQNRSASICGLGFDPQTDTTTHFAIDANGGMMSMNLWEDGEVVGYEVWAISPVAGAQFEIIEVTA